MQSLTLSPSKIYNCLYWFIPAFFVASFLETSCSITFLDDIIKSGALLLSLLLLVGSKYRKSLQIFNCLLVLFVMSIIAYLYNGRPLKCITTDLLNLIPSMMFFLIGMNENNLNRNFYDRMMYVGAGFLTLGILCYISMPSWYMQKMLEYKNEMTNAGVEYSESSLLSVLRFYSFFKDSYPVSLFSIYILSISLFSIFRKDKKMKYSVLCGVVSMISAILCMHRVSIGCAFIIVFVFFSYEIIKSDGKRVIGIVGVFVLIAVCSYFISNTVQERIDNI